MILTICHLFVLVSPACSLSELLETCLSSLLESLSNTIVSMMPLKIGIKVELLRISMLHDIEDSGLYLTLVRQIKEQNWKFLSVISLCQKGGHFNI